MLLMGACVLHSLNNETHTRMLGFPARAGHNRKNTHGHWKLGIPHHARFLHVRVKTKFDVILHLVAAVVILYTGELTLS